jgi:hypothetical protein
MHLTRIRPVALVATGAVGDFLGHRMFALHPRSLPRPLAQVFLEGNRWLSRTAAEASSHRESWLPP